VHFQENGERAREAGMSVLMGATLSVRVISVDDQTERVVLSMLQPRETGGGSGGSSGSSGSSGGSRSGLGGGGSSPGPSHAVSHEVLQQASAKVGSILPCTVTNVTDFGVFCRFDVNGTEMVGLVYRTEISWLEDGDVAMKDISVGATRPAKVVHVDMNKAHVFLSFKRTMPNPLLETLDTLMMSGGDRSASTGTGRETVESIDLRPLLGDMDDAVAIANSLRQAGFHRVALGPRLNSKATSQAVELYLAKAKPGEGEQTTMIVRRGDAVQEIIVGSSDRERIKNVVGSLQLDNSSGNSSGNETD
jgi:predicted RNA-binding protein with RPS1 domain